MNTNKDMEKIKQLLKRLRTISKGFINEESATKTSKPQKIEFHSIAYKFIGEKTERFLPLFKDLDLNLQKSGLRVSFKAYVSLTVFTAILLLVAALAIIPSILFLGFGVPLIPSLMFGIGGGLFACAFSVIGYYVYPVYRADKIKRDLEDELPFTTGYMAILSSAGVSPEKIFYSLSNLTPPLAITNEAKNIVRNINLFGLDVISALEETSRLTPSERFREMLEGFISTIHSGGNLAHYLREKSTQYMKLKRISLRKFSDTLSILSEFYVALLVTGPLLLVIMLAVMGMLGGGLGTLGPDILLNILTYIGIPLSSIMFLIILDAVSPKW
ncbi:MAG: type II secretion system F family protein [Candidatus Bathyarchaeia archaeon]